METAASHKYRLGYQGYLLVRMESIALHVASCYYEHFLATFRNQGVIASYSHIMFPPTWLQPFPTNLLCEHLGHVESALKLCIL